uniref:Cadherin domain-containing protein n=1 Tax=Esox lucius TaxID=8010 RepID=A0A3P8YLD2_ESOLU
HPRGFLTHPSLSDAFSLGWILEILIDKETVTIFPSHFLKELLVRSKRRWVLSTFEIQEEDPGPFPKLVTQMFNDNMDMLQNNRQFRLTGNGVTEDPLDVFFIDNHDGSVYVRKPIDREKYPLFNIKFDILDKQTGELVDRTLAFNVAIKDINDNPPTFEKSVMTDSISENSAEGYLPVQLKPTDIDEENTDNSKISVRVLSQEPAEPKISVKQVEGTKMSQLTFTVIVEAKDHGIPVLSSTATVILNILDSNTHPPLFKDNTMESNKEIVRVSVTDADTPNTPGWRAVYSIVKGNEDGNYKIVTDPKTNEGVLSVIKVSPFEPSRSLSRNCWSICSGQRVAHSKMQTVRSQTTNVTVKVIDVNDPPVFQKNVTDVYVKEEDQPGKMLYKPKVTDVDSDLEKIRYELVDPAGWVTIDPKTGAVTTVKPMDRESSYVNKDNIYSILVRAIDNGEPPATATGTVLIHLGDINDNIPHVVKKELVMCGNKVNVTVEDKDQSPFSCPCSFSLGVDDKEKSLKRMEAGLVSLKSLPYGNYTVPLVIQDQQGQGGNSTVHVLVCDCGEVDICRALLPRTSTLGWAAIGLLLAGLLLLLRDKTLAHLPINLQDEGNQTLIKYNEEGGGSACKVCCMTVGVPRCVHVSVCSNNIGLLAHSHECKQSEVALSYKTHNQNSYIYATLSEA